VRDYVWRKWSTERDILVEEKKYMKAECRCDGGFRKMRGEVEKKMFGRKGGAFIFASPQGKTGAVL
jgi:hypothetical protein